MARPARAARPAARRAPHPERRPARPEDPQPAAGRHRPSPPRDRGRRGTSSLLLQLLDLRPRARVQHVVFRKPRAARLSDAELDVVERPDLMAVGVDHELEPGLARGARVYVRQVEAIGLRVDLEERPSLERLLDDTLDVDLRRRALADLPVREMADAVDVR